MKLTFQQFQDQALPVRPVPTEDTLLYPSNALGGEAGEVQNIVKKMVRDDRYDELDERLLSEAGDVLFYLRMLLDKRGYTLEDAAEACLEKLELMRAEL